jgi:adenylate cyclase
MELDDVRDGRQLWGQHYTRNVAELLMVQDDIAKEVSQQLRSQLSPADRQRMNLGSTANADAYRLYLKGWHYTNKFAREGFRQGIEYLNQAIALDPNYANAYSAPGFNYINRDDGILPPRDSAPKAKDATLKARGPRRQGQRLRRARACVRRAFVCARGISQHRREARVAEIRPAFCRSAPLHGIAGA